MYTFSSLLYGMLLVHCQFNTFSVSLKVPRLPRGNLLHLYIYIIIHCINTGSQNHVYLLVVIFYTTCRIYAEDFDFRKQSLFIVSNFFWKIRQSLYSILIMHLCCFQTVLAVESITIYCLVLKLDITIYPCISRVANIYDFARSSTDFSLKCTVHVLICGGIW